ncbi:MAG TPA: phosphatidate cytidylyltransferase [Flavobacterium sp.]
MRETLTRTLSGIVYIVLLTLAVFYSYESFLFLFATFLILCVLEYCMLVRISHVLPVLAALILYVLFAVFDPTPTTDLLLLIVTLLISIQALFFLFKKFTPIDRLSKIVYLVGYIILPFVILTKIPMQDEYNPKVIFSIFLLCWISDTFAYVVGKSIGRNPLFKSISPKKTIEGFAGGFIFALIGAYFIAEYFVSQPTYIWLITAAIVVIFGTLGDLIESKFKRLAEVKDSGKIMPGHGGILDRLDSVIFAAPFVLLFFQIINYVS